MNEIYENSNRMIRMMLSIMLFSIVSLNTLAQSVSFVRTVSTYAGTTQGFLNDTITKSQFNKPYGLAYDATGNMYLADRGNHCIRKITPTGLVSTFAGTPGTSGTTDGAASVAKFNSPTGVAVDASGNVFVADQINHRIRMITSGGVVSTLAGSNTATITAGFKDSTGTFAKFNNPVSVAVDASGNVYVGDQTNHRIRKITSGGVVTTFAGSGPTSGAGALVNGPVASARFYLPYGVAVDASGDVYVADLLNNAIRKISGGIVSTLAGGTSGSLDGTGTNAQFSQPYGVTIDNSGNAYVTDYLNQSIRKVTQAGIVSTIASNGTGTAGLVEGLGPAARFDNPIGIISDASGNLYVGDSYYARIRKITNPSLNAFSTNYGVPSLTQNFNVMGSVLTTDLVVTAPSGYEVSTSSSGPFTNSVTFAQVSGKVSSKQIFIRLSATAPGGPNNGNISLTSTGVVTEVLPVTGTVTKVNQTITFGTLAPITYINGPYNPGATTSSSLAITYASDNAAVATVSSDGLTVTIVGTGTVNITASQAGNNTFNAATDVTRQLTVNKASQTITIPPLPIKIVGDPNFDPGATTNSGLPITYTISDPAVATVSGNIVTIVGAGTANIIATQAGNNNYLSATTVQSFTVKKNQTITFGALTPIVFAAGVYNPGATTSSPLTVTYISDNSAVATVSGSTVTIVGAGTVNITANQVGNGTYIAAVPVTQQLIVNKADQTISNFNTLPVKTIGDAPFNLTDAIASSGLAVTYTSSDPLVATITNGNKVTIVGAGTTTITATQAGNTNYNTAPAIPTQTLTVNPASQSITFDPFNSATYGDPVITLNLNASSGLAITYVSSNTSVATVLNNVVTIVGAGSTDITASQAGNSNYSAALSITRTLTVDKANPAITFSIPAKTMIDADFDLDNLASSTSPVTLTFVSDNPAVAMIDANNVVMIMGVGTANITVSQATNTNYFAASAVRALVVTLAPQTITFTIPAKTMLDSDFNLDALASTNSLLPLTYTSDNTAVATINASTHVVTIVGPGTANITASQAGNADYASANEVRALVVTKVAQTITFNILPASFVNSPDFTLGATTTSPLPVSYTSSNLAVATITNGNTVHIVGAGVTNITASQAGSPVYNAASDVMRILTVNAAAGLTSITMLDSKIYPNPTADMLIIEPKQPLNGDLTLRISDMQGKIAYSLKVLSGEESYRVDISGLELGVYMLELSNGKQVISQRIVKK